MSDRPEVEAVLRAIRVALDAKDTKTFDAAVKTAEAKVRALGAEIERLTRERDQWIRQATEHVREHNATLRDLKRLTVVREVVQPAPALPDDVRVVLERFAAGRTGHWQRDRDLVRAWLAQQEDTHEHG